MMLAPACGAVVGSRRRLSRACSPRVEQSARARVCHLVEGSLVTGSRGDNPVESESGMQLSGRFNNTRTHTLLPRATDTAGRPWLSAQMRAARTRQHTTTPGAATPQSPTNRSREHAPARRLLAAARSSCRSAGLTHAHEQQKAVLQTQVLSVSEVCASLARHCSLLYQWRADTQRTQGQPSPTAPRPTPRC
jgi:hypothetical protein